MTDGPLETTRRTCRRLNTSAIVLIFVLALACRVGWGTYRSATPKFPDEIDYWSLATSLADGNGLVGEHGFRALRMPLYSVFLSPFTGLSNGVFVAKMFQSCIGAVAAVFIALLGNKIGGRWVGVSAGLAVACDPFLVFFSSLLLTETFYITALCATWLVGWDLQHRTGRSQSARYCSVGILIATCIYLRDGALPLCAGWLGFILVRRGFDRAGVAGTACAAAIVVASLLPWAARNARVTGDWCFLTHRTGISLYDGVGPQATGASDLGEIKQSSAVAGLDEVAWDNYFRTESMRSIKADPLRVLRLAAVKIARTWNPLPNADAYRSRSVRLISAAWTLPVYLFSLAGVVVLAKRDGWSATALLLPAASVFLLHAVFVGSVRYRLPAMPMLEVLAAVGVVAVMIRRTASAAPANERPPDL